MPEPGSGKLRQKRLLHVTIPDGICPRCSTMGRLTLATGHTGGRDPRIRFYSAATRFPAVIFLQRETDGNRREASKGQIAKVIHVRPQRGLLVERALEQFQRAVRRVHGVGMNGHQALQPREPTLKRGTLQRERMRQFVSVQL